MFLGQKLFIPIDVSAEWLFAKTELRRRRCWIRNNHFYVREKEDFIAGPVEKYRLIRRNLTSYTIKIVKVH